MSSTPTQPPPSKESLSNDFTSALQSEIGNLIETGSEVVEKPSQEQVEVPAKSEQPEPKQESKNLYEEVENFFADSKESGKEDEKMDKKESDLESKQRISKEDRVKQGKKEWAQIRDKAKQYDLLKPKLEETENKYKEVSEKIREYEEAKIEIQKLKEENERSKKILERLPYASTMSGSYKQNKELIVGEIIQRAKAIGRDEKEVLQALRLSPDQRDEALTELFGITHWPRVANDVEKLDKLEYEKESFLNNPDDAIQFIKQQEAEKSNQFQERRKNIILETLKKAREKFPEYQKVEGDENHNKLADELYQQAEHILLKAAPMPVEDAIKLQASLISAGLAYFKGTPKLIQRLNELQAKVEEYEAKEMAEQELEPDINATSQTIEKPKPKNLKDELMSEVFE